MEERSNHLTVVVGASAVAEELRRSLVQHGVAHAGVAAHLRGLRKSMVLGENDLVVVCISLDQPTLERHGGSLRQMMADHHCFPQAMRTVGLLTDLGLTRDVAELGCDVFVHDTKDAAKAIGQLTRRWQSQRRIGAQSRFSNSAESDAAPFTKTWSWGSSQLPIDLVQMVCARPADDEVRNSDPAAKHGRVDEAQGRDPDVSG